MHILLLDPNTESARQLHLKMLGYKGIYWDLEHFARAEDATTALMREAFDVVVIRLRGDESLEGELQTFFESARSLPTVALIDADFTSSETQWLAIGFADVIHVDNISAEWLMRRMRIAIARQERQIQDLEYAKNRLKYAQVSRGNLDDLPNDVALLSRIESEKTSDTLNVAILRDHGTARLLEGAGESVNIEVFRDTKSYAQSILDSPTRFDIAIFEQEFFEREGNRILELEQLRFPSPPAIFVTSDRSDASAVTLINEGFDDCVPARACSTNSLLRLVRLSLARWNYNRLQLQQTLSALPTAPDRRQTARGRDRRVGSRYLVTRPLLAIPVLADGSPDRANIRDAFSIDFAIGGLGFQISNHNGIPGRNWIIGVETNLGDGKGDRFHYSHVVVRNVSYPQGGVRMGAQFQPPNHDLLHPDNLIPELRLESGRFEHQMSALAMENWMELGVLRPKMLHRVQTCPECQAVATSGQGCHECGSPDIQFKELIHHFACAAVDDSRQFDRNGQICCPKCLAKALVVGVDFELIHSHYQCMDCGHEGSVIADVCTCLHCRLRFPKSLAAEEVVYGYDVDRLDILALLNSTN